MYGTIIFDQDTYQRFLELNVSYNGDGTPKDINISLSATWVDASVATRTSDNSWSSVFTPLKNKGMEQITNTSDMAGKSMAGYYLRTTLASGTSLNRLLQSRRRISWRWHSNIWNYIL